MVATSSSSAASAPAQRFVSDLASCISAGYGLVGVSSWEEDRVERAVAVLCGSSKRRLRVWSAGQGFGDGEARAPLDALHAVLDDPEGTVYLFKDFHPFLTDPVVLRSLRDLEPSLPGQKKVLILLSPHLEAPLELEKDMAFVDVPLPDENELHALLSESVSQRKSSLPEDTAAAMARAARGLTARDAKRVFRRALLAEGDPVSAVLDNKSRLLRTSELLEYTEPGGAALQLGGLSELKRWLRVRQRAFSEQARAFGLPEPRGVFLLGVQGCGKSLAAKAVADSWQLPLLRLDVSGLVAGDRTPSEALRRATKVAESMSPSILWIDEIEKGFHGAGSDSLATRALGAFVTWMQERTAPVFVVATANEVENLPPELLRRGRFDEIFFVDLPDVHDREEILAIHLVKRGRNAQGFDLKAAARQADRFSGAELEQAVISALYLAFEAEEELGPAHLTQAINETVPLAVTMEETIEQLRRWARNRARGAAIETQRLDYFGGDAE